MKKLTLIVFLLSMTRIIFAQENTAQPYTENQTDFKNYTFAYIAIKNGPSILDWSVSVDFGDTKEERLAAFKYEQILYSKRSYAGILNQMTKDGFELVESLNLYKGSAAEGGKSEVAFILKKKIIDPK